MVPETPAPVSTLILANCTIIVRLSKILCGRLFERLTQTVTQTGIGAGSRQRNQRSGQQIILSQKGRKGRDSPFFPPPTYLHTQEVTGSSPVVSTKKFLISSEIRNFSIYFSAKSLLQNLTFALTNTLTNTAKVPHRTGQHRAGFPARLCFFTRFWNHYSESKKLTLYCDRVTDGYRCKDRGSRFNRNRKKEQDEALLFTFRGSGPP